MPIMRAVGASKKTFKVPCSGKGIFVAVNTSIGTGSVAYWNGTRTQSLTSSSLIISSITVQDGIATVIVTNQAGGSNSSTRVCFIPGDPLASN